MAAEDTNTTIQNSCTSSSNLPYFVVSLVRHAETPENKNEIFQGQMDTDLSSEGIRQASLLANRLEYEAFSHIFSSDLIRAKTTAEEVIRRNCFCHDLSLAEDARLRERLLGEAEGKPREEVARLAAKQNLDILNYTPPGGEPLLEVKKRVKEFFCHLCQELGTFLQTSSRFYANEDNNFKKSDVLKNLPSMDSLVSLSQQAPFANVLVVSHGGTIRQLICHFLWDLRSEFPERWKRKVKAISPNTGISRFEVYLNVKTKMPEYVSCIYLHNADHLHATEQNN